MSKKEKIIFWVTAVIILCLAGGSAYEALHRRNNSVAIAPVNTDVEVTSTAQALANPAAVFRLDLKDQAPIVTSTVLGKPLLSTTSIPIAAIIPTSSFASLTNLTLLNLAGDNLGSVPPEIGDMQDLQVLYLNNNQLTSLPPEIGNLSQLWMLSLYNNQLTSLPPAIANLKKLKILGLTGNPIAKSSTAIAALRKELPTSTQIIIK